MNNSSDADGDELTYSWNFGDGETSTVASPKHTYEEAGTYEVSLTVSDGQIEKTTKKNVVVNKKVDPEENVAPVADFSAKATGLSVAFKNNSSDEDGDTLEYSWDFGDGKTSTAANPTYKYAKKGTYDVVLTVTDGKETATKKLSVTVNDGNVGDNHAPVVDFYYEFKGLDGFVMSNVTDEDGDTLTYHWDFGDGNTSDKMEPSHKYATGGEKVVTLTVSDGKETVSKTYRFTLQNVEIVKPTKNGIYYNGKYTHIYVWRSEQDKPFGDWPGKAMDSASESSAWKFVDTSSVGNDKINLIFNGGGQTGDIKGVSPKGCYKNDTWIEYDQCTLSDQDVETISGGKKPVGNVVIGDIPWYELDYDDAGKGLTITSDISGVQSAPFVTTNLAPGSHYSTKTLELSLEDADRRRTSGTIYYTFDNTRPTESSAKYTGPITLEDTSEDGLGTAYRLRVLVKGDNGMSQEQSFFWFFKKNKTVASATDFRDETIYFVLPARYYDGDKSNNYHCRDRFDSNDPSWRGDFKGLIEKLDYIKGMGFTAIWLTPPVENRSGLDYHGYHAYDWFQTDLRLESPGATYFDLIKAAHKKGIKIVQDVVLNHSSNYGIRGQVYLPKIPTKYYVDPAYGKGGIDNGPYQGTLGDYNSINRCDNDNPVAPAWHRRLCAGDPDALATFTLRGTEGETINIAGVADKSINNHYWWNPGNQGEYLPSKWYHNGYTNNWESVNEVQQRSMAGDCVDLRTESKHVQDYMNSAMNMYIDMGIDAVRIDTLKHMPREEVISMVSTWQAKKPGMFVFGEALIKGFGDNTPSELLPWYYTRTSSASSKSGDSGISVLDFSLMSTFRDNVTKGGLNGLADVFNRFDNDYADATKLVTFFQNHDLTPDNTWSGAGAQHCCTDRKNSALAYNVLWTVRGIPVMYAGDETGARVGLPPDLTSSNDLVKDTGRLYIGDSLDNGDPIIGHITDLNAIRKSSKALQRGKLKVLNGEPLIFERIYENERAIVAIVGSGGGTANVSGATDGSYVDVVTGQKYTVSGGSVNLGSIPGSSMRVLIKDYSGGKVAGKSQFLK